MASSFDEKLVIESWPVVLNNDAARAPFESAPGWGLFYKRDLDGARSAFATEPALGVGVARVELYRAAMDRQSARLAAASILQVYGADRQPTDPAEVDYLVAVSAAFLGVDPPPEAQAGAVASKVFGARVAAWEAVGGLGPVPPGGRDLGLLAATVATPGTGEFTAAEDTADKRSVPLVDPAAPWVSSESHRAAAKVAWPEGGPTLDALLGLWQLPGERCVVPAAGALEGVDDRWLFGEFVLGSGDVGFLLALCSDPAAVDAWAGRSLMAAIARDARDQTTGLIDVDRVDQAALDLEHSLVARMRSDGGDRPFQRDFARLARVAVLRGVAAAVAQPRDAAVLRLRALELSEKAPALDYRFVLSQAAYDAGQRNALRAEELVHPLVRLDPNVAAAGVALDALNLRLSRNAAPAVPVH